MQLDVDFIRSHFLRIFAYCEHLIPPRVNTDFSQL